MPLARFGLRLVAVLLAVLLLFAALAGPVAAQADLRDAQAKVSAFNAAGNFQEALKWAEQVLAIAERDLGPESGEAASGHLLIAIQQQSLGRLPAAEEHYKRGLAIQKKVVPANELALSVFEAGLGGMLYGQGRYEDAEPYMRSSLRFQEGLARRTGDVSGLGVALYMLGSNYTAMNRLDDAYKLLQRSLAAFEKITPQGSLQTGIVLNNLATNRQLANDYAASVDYQQRALQQFERYSPTNLPGIAKCHNNLAFLFQQAGQYDKAAEQYKIAISQLRKAFPDGHSDIATASVNYGGLLLEMGRTDEAERLLVDSLAMRKRWLPADHSEVAQSHGELANLWIRRGAWRRAVEDLEAAGGIYVTRSARQDAGRGSAVGNDVVQNAFTFRKIVKVRYRAGPADIGPAFVAAQHAVGSTAANSLAQMASRSAKGDPRLASLVRSRQDLVAQWHALDRNLVAALARSDQSESATEPIRRRLADMDTEITNLDKRIAAQFPEFTALANPAPLSIAEVQAILAPDEALLLILDTPQYLTMPEESFVWVVTKKEARWVRSDLGSSALAERVAVLRCGLDRDGEWRWAEGRDRWLAQHRPCAVLAPDGLGDGDPLPFDPATAFGLYEGLFAGAGTLMAGKKLLIAASGPLTSLPFQVLVTRQPKPGEGLRALRWLVHDHAVTVLPSVNSISALRRSARPSRAASPYLGIGNPLLDGLDSSFTAAREAALARSSCGNLPPMKVAALAPTRALPAVTTRGGIADVAQLRRAAPLPETADELCDVARLLGAAETDVLLGARSTEGEIERLSDGDRLREYRVVHFATHGALAGEASGASEPGLVLTPPAVGSASDDGYLAASEVAGLKLDADWVILSACNTAGGEAKGAEALSGLARAFFYAGARALLVSHWYVNSDATVALVKGAFEQLRAEPGVGRAEAVRRSMLALIEKGPAMFAEPGNWAPFVIVGEGGSGR